MSPDEIAFIEAAVAFVLLAATGLGAYWLRIRARALSGGDTARLQLLADDQARIQANLESRVAELEERLDFAERRLIQSPPSQARAEPRPHSTPV